MSKPSDATDVIRWVDTDIMACDPLTKKMEGAKLTNAMDSNYWDLRQLHEALLKERSSRSRGGEHGAMPNRHAKRRTLANWRTSAHAGGARLSFSPEFAQERSTPGEPIRPER